MKTLDATLAAHTELSTLLVTDITDLQMRTSRATTTAESAQDIATKVQSETQDALASSAAISMALSKQMGDIALAVQGLRSSAPSPIPSNSSIPTAFANTLDSLQDLCNSVGS
jgi:hypothetical protein